MSKNQEKYLKEAIRIGDELLAKAVIDDSGYCWKTMGMSGEAKETTPHISEGIYSGTAGVVFFFVELYKHTHDEKYKKAFVEGAKWLEHYCANNPSHNYAFYTGRLGVAYLMIVIGDLLKDQDYNKKALKIAKGCESFLETGISPDDLINGYSGSILALLHIHAVTKDATILKNIEQFIWKLIDSTQITEHGFYWDRSIKNIRGLCGFSHGAAGVGYVFLELGRYFNNDLFYWIAKQAFAYENHYFDTENGNWPDFRKGFFNEDIFLEHKQKYLNGDKNFFLQTGNMSAWCHGAPGVGLARVRAYQLLNEKTYLEDLNKAVENTKSVGTSYMQPSSFTLCHGIGGNAILLLEAHALKPNDEYVDWVCKEADYIIDYKAKGLNYTSGYAFDNQEDTSLFMGNAGIGYFLLLAHDGKLQQPSILKPDVTAAPVGNILDFTAEKLTHRLYKKLFPKTQDLVLQNFVKEVDIENLLDVKTTLTDHLERYVQKTDDETLQKVFEFEKKKNQIDEAIESHSYKNISRVVEVELNKELFDNPKELMEARLVVPEDFEIVSNPDPKDEGEGEIILAPMAEGIMEFPINDFVYAVIEKFENGETVASAVQRLVEDFDVTDKAEIHQVQEASIAQIKEAMAQGILCTSRLVDAS